MIKLSFPIVLAKVIQVFLTSCSVRAHLGYNIYNKLFIQGYVYILSIKICTAKVPQLENCALLTFADDRAILSSEIIAVIANLSDKLCHFNK